MRIRRALPLLVLLLWCSSAPAAEPTDFEIMVQWMSGSFASTAQAEADSSYLDIRLEMKPIWTERGDGAWLYVEQAVAWALDKPYRQRVYHVQDQGGGHFTSAVYSLPDPASAVGAWQQEQPLADLGPDDLLERTGCVVHLERTADGTFTGGTHERECTSELRGATWASTEIEIRPDGMTSWDRGWDDAGEQVWGAEPGGYVFLRRQGP